MSRRRGWRRNRTSAERHPRHQDEKRKAPVAARPGPKFMVVGRHLAFVARAFNWKERENPFADVFPFPCRDLARPWPDLG